MDGEGRGHGGERQAGKKRVGRPVEVGEGRSGPGGQKNGGEGRRGGDGVIEKEARRPRGSEDRESGVRGRRGDGRRGRKGGKFGKKEDWPKTERGDQGARGGGERQPGEWKRREGG